MLLSPNFSREIYFENNRGQINRNNFPIYTSSLTYPEIERSWLFHNAKATSVQSALNTLIATENQNLINEFGSISKLKSQLDQYGVHVNEIYSGLTNQVARLCKVLVSFFIKRDSDRVKYHNL